MLYQYTIYPIECVYKILYLFFADVLGHYGLSLIALSLLTSFIIHPFMKWAAKLQKEEKHLQDVMKPQLDTIKAESKGAEQYQRIQRMYKRYGYHPIMAIRSALGVALQIPFLMAAFYMLSKLPDIQGISWGIVKNLGKPDGLLAGYNLFPFLMTAVNLLGAYTTKGFSKRDKLQAIVIAGLFLVLLYNAPSALLIYWTCNNLWTLLGNVKEIIVERCGITVLSVTIKGKSAAEWVTGMPDALYVCLALAATACVLVPADVYLVNSNELWFTLPDILKYLLLGAIALFLILGILYYLLPGQRNRAIFTAIITGLLLGLYLQSYVINLDYGILDGRTIKWSAFKKEAVLNCLAWAACVFVPLLSLRYFKAESFVKAAKKAAIFLVIVQLCSAFYVAGTAGNNQKKVADNRILTTEKEFTVSSKDNIIVFVLDAFESKTFRDIQKNNPELAKKLNGFVYYPDAASLFGFTDYSVPQMLTNKVFVNQSSYKDYLKEAWKNNPFFTYLKKKNYDIRVFTFSNFVFGAENSIDNLEKATYVVDRKTVQNFSKLALFREMPHILKKHFLIYSGVLRNPVVDFSSKKPYRENDVAFYNELTKGLKVTQDKNCFRFYHLNGAHEPYTMTAAVRRAKKGTKVTKYQQAVGALKIVLEFISQMQKNNIYANTTFAVLADHGKHNSIGTSPIVLIKKPNAPDVPLRTMPNAISFEGLHATLLQRYGEEAAEFGTTFEKENLKERLFYVVRNNVNQDISLEKYVLNGNSEDRAAWNKAETIGSSNVISDNSYKLGTEIVFSTLGNSFKYTGAGWSQPVLNHRWINSAESECSFTLSDYQKGDLQLIVKGIPSLRDKSKSRDLTVFVNGTRICLWKTDKFKTYFATIPEALIKDQTVKIVFKVEKPIPAKIDGAKRQFSVTSMLIK